MKKFGKEVGGETGVSVFRKYGFIKGVRGYRVRLLRI